MDLSTEQKQVLQAFHCRKNVFLTGPGGSGKTALIKHMVELGERDSKVVQVCALTGCAAVLLDCKGAKTVHSWAGIGLANGEISDIIHAVSTNKHKRKTWLKTEILIIDEVSMMSKKLFELLSLLGQRIRKKPNVPFGGMQVIFSGDFYQLPPVGNFESPDSSAFCFESKDWKRTFTATIQLTKIFRQSDESYCKILNQIRVGKLSKSSYTKLMERVRAEKPKTELRPTLLFPRRRDVEIINATELKKLKTEEKTYNIIREDDLTSEKKSAAFMDMMNPENYEREWKHLENNIMADKKLVLKVGAQVMCVANIDMEGDFPIVNGSQGIVTEFHKNLPMVQFNDGQKRLISEHTWSSEICPKLGVKQIPLIHAWAITIHKSQGVTLDIAEIDAGNSIFECGQTYVALSRVKALSGLHLTSFNPNKIKINRKVMEFYKSI